jgi:hypothetical protein
MRQWPVLAWVQDVQGWKDKMQFVALSPGFDYCKEAFSALASGQMVVHMFSILSSSLNILAGLECVLNFQMCIWNINLHDSF